MKKITLEIPEPLMDKLQNQTDTIQNILLKALDQYLEQEASDITQTKTWELCGSLEIPEPESEFIVDKESIELSTNYAENVDKILY